MLLNSKCKKKNPYNLRIELILFIVGGFVLIKLTFGIFVWMAYNCIHSMAASIEKVCNVCKSFYFISSLFFYKKKQFPPLECTETAWYKFNVNIGWYQKNPNVFFMAKNLHWFEEFFWYLSYEPGLLSYRISDSNYFSRISVNLKRDPNKWIQNSYFPKIFPIVQLFVASLILSISHYITFADKIISINCIQLTIS